MSNAAGTFYIDNVRYVDNTVGNPNSFSALDAGKQILGGSRLQISDFRLAMQRCRQVWAMADQYSDNWNDGSGNVVNVGCSNLVTG